MDLKQRIFKNTDISAATGLTPATIQTWANRGILSLSEEQRNPGPGRKRLYSMLDAARIAAIQSLIGHRLTASAAGRMAFRLEHSPLTREDWEKALQEHANHIHILVRDDDVVGVYTDKDRSKLTNMLNIFSDDSTCGFGGQGTRERIKPTVFDIGPAVSAAIGGLRRRPNSAGEAVSASIKENQSPPPTPALET